MQQVPRAVLLLKVKAGRALPKPRLAGAVRASPCCGAIPMCHAVQLMPSRGLPPRGSPALSGAQAVAGILGRLGGSWSSRGWFSVGSMLRGSSRGRCSVGAMLRGSSSWLPSLHRGYRLWRLLLLPWRKVVVLAVVVMLVARRAWVGADGGGLLPTRCALHLIVGLGGCVHNWLAAPVRNSGGKDCDRR